MYNLGKEKQTLIKNQKEMLEIKNTVTNSAEGTSEGCMRVMRARAWSQTDMGSNPALVLPGCVTLNRYPFSGIQSGEA